MLFSAYIGESEGLERWRKTVEGHARWTGLENVIATRALGRRDRPASPRALAACWLARELPDPPPLVESAGRALMGTLGPLRNAFEVDGLWERPAEPFGTNESRLGVALESGEVRLAVPPTTPEQLYYARDSCGLVVSNDLRMLLRGSRLEVDQAALYALLQYGSIPPPLAISQTVRRVPSGCLLRFDGPNAEPLVEPVSDLPGGGGYDMRSGRGEQAVATAIDASLDRLPAGSTLFFSGGVDSGLLAARLAAKGRTDVALLNCAFGADDPEAEIARRMAAHLRLPYERVTFRPQDTQACLERIGSDYSVPFGDTAVAATNMLVHAALERDLGTSVVEGTGADGLFGIWEKQPAWRAIYSTPRPLRELASRAYARLRLWKGESRAEYVGRLARRSVQMPPLLAAVAAQNALDGIAYSIPASDRRTVDGHMQEHFRLLGPRLGPKREFALADLVHVCAGQFAAKSFDPLRVTGRTPLYPFLEPAVVRAVFSLAWAAPDRRSGPKPILKRLLARSVPADLVYRRKSAFTPPYGEMFGHPATQELLRDVILAPDNPLVELCAPDALDRLLERTHRGHSLSVGAYYFLWSLTFSSAWLKQVRRIADGSRSRR